MSPRRTLILSVLLLVFMHSARAQTAALPQFGPAKGTLIIIGGGGKSQAIIQRFIQTAGGPDAVGVYDARSAAWKTETPWLTLREGAAFDLRSRSVVKESAFRK